MALARVTGRGRRLGRPRAGAVEIAQNDLHQVSVATVGGRARCCQSMAESDGRILAADEHDNKEEAHPMDLGRGSDDVAGLRQQQQQQQKKKKKKKIKVERNIFDLDPLSHAIQNKKLLQNEELLHR